MRAGRDAARACGVRVERLERVEPFGDGWLIRDRGGFTPCPWAYDLARFANPTGESILDLGCGSGALLVALRDQQSLTQFRVTMCMGIELHPRSADQARRNLTLAGYRGLIVDADIRDLSMAPEAFSLVVSNPPFYPPNWGRLSSDPAVAGATHELAGDINAFTQAAAYALAPRGRAIFIYDASRLSALLLALAKSGLSPRAARFLDDDRGKPSRVLVRATRTTGGMQIDRQAYSG